MHKYLEELLQGETVEWKTLGEVCDIKRGRVISKKDLAENVGDYPVYSSQTMNNGEIGRINTYDLDGEYATWTTDGAYAGTVFYRYGKFSITNICGLLSPKNKDILLVKYLVYVLQGIAKNYVHSASGNPKLMSNVVSTILIPIPSLKTQQKIVDILDKLCELKTALKTERDLRLKQYEYYRDKLLTFGDEVEWKELGEVCENTQNIQWNKINSRLTFPYIDLTSVDREKHTILQTININSNDAPSRAKKIVLEDDVIFATTRPSQQRYCLIDKNYNNSIASTGYCILRANKNYIFPKWILFLLSSYRFKEYVTKNESGTAYPSISDTLVKEFLIPIPPLEKQKQIIDILDKLDTYCNSLTSGLPREIELREKQYQYYRDLLLGFDRE
ncbi:restriction endonuclease subunit S [Actinobacillus delphinicola]|uniref:restriction endonuclease subunit S n=1 Tax=Actinobacillus delphinicola TaxID=51161 RepID=UPI002442BC7B|nr:restriction endonuclease subunit S [Actinobacillus delphinicola]MDG6897387.1 restriction endonuclease subunit S [Actinobacillus delphinicola]